MGRMKYNEALKYAIRCEMIRDSRVLVLGQDVGIFDGNFKVTAGLLGEFGGKRIVDTPLCEMVPTGMAVGAAIAGLRPIMEICYMDFLGMTMDPILNQAAKARYMFGGKVNVPVVFRLGFGPGKQRAAHHSQALEAWLMHIPGLKIVAPSDSYDAIGLFRTAVRDDNPVAFIEHKMLYDQAFDVPDNIDDYVIPFCKAKVKREGKDISIITYAKMVGESLKAAKALAEEGIDAEVLDLRSLAPLDREAMKKTALKTGRVVIVHDAAKTGGIGGEIASVLLENKDVFSQLKAPVIRVGALDLPLPYAENLEKIVIPDLDSIVEAVKEVMAN